MRNFVAAFALTLCCALAPYTASASQDPALNTESLLRAHDRFARELELDGAIEGFVPNLTQDVAYLHPDQEIITGREATRAFLKTIYPQPRAVRTGSRASLQPTARSATPSAGWKRSRPRRMRRR